MNGLNANLPLSLQELTSWKNPTFNNQHGFCQQQK